MLMNQMLSIYSLKTAASKVKASWWNQKMLTVTIQVMMSLMCNAVQKMSTVIQFMKGGGSEPEDLDSKKELGQKLCDMKKRKKPTYSMYEGESEPEDLFCKSDYGSSDDSGCQRVSEPVTKKKKNWQGRANNKISL